MRRNFLAAALVLAALPAASLAQQARAGASSDNSASVNSQAIDLASGTRLAAELQGALDVSKARVGDRVILKTTEAIKSGGRTVLKKGSTLVGHVSDVQRRARGSAASSLTVIFDRLESGSLSAPVSATIDSITHASARAGDDETRARTSSSARASGNSSSGGGLLGGVTDAVGNTVGGVTGAAGDVLGSTTETVGDTLGRVQITQSASLSADAGTTLSLAGGNLRIEKGTTFRLTLNESASVGNR